MATTKPRITITLPPHTHEVLARFASASGNSMSQVVSGFVDLAVPSLERLVVVMERARTAPEEVRAGLIAAFERADRDVMPQVLAAAAQGEMFLGDLADKAQGAPEPEGGPTLGGSPRVRTRRSPPSDPRPVTRGSGRSAGPKKVRKA